MSFRSFFNNVIIVISTSVFGVPAIEAPAQAADTIKIGLPLPLTGSLAEGGVKEEHGYDMCADAVHARGGVNVGGKRYQLELVKYDYQSQTGKAVQLIQRMINVDKVNFLFGPFGSGDSKAAASVAERYGVPMLASGAAARSVYDQNYKNLFGTLYPVEAITDAEIAFYQKANPAPKTIAVLEMNSLAPKAIADNIKAAADRTGIKIVFDAVYSPGTDDFASSLTQIKAEKPDWIYVTGYMQATVLVRRQMADLGVDAPIITMALGPAYPEFLDNLKDLAEGVTATGWFAHEVHYEDNILFGSTKRYDTEFFAKYHQHPIEVEASASAACEILVNAIEIANSTDVDAVRKVLQTHQFDTFFGPVRFGPTGQNMISNPVIVQVQKGDVVILDPPAMAQRKLVLRPNQK